MNELVLTNQGLEDRAAWEEKGYVLPRFDRAAMVQKTLEAPAWIHFGAGNIFKAFQAHAMQRLLDEGLAETGIIAAERRKKGEDLHDGLTVLVTLKTDGTVGKAVIASIADTVYLYGEEARLQEMFRNPSLQMVSFTITEKGYSLVDGAGQYLPDAAADLAGGPETASSYMGRLTALLYARYRAGAFPLAMVSMDNCSHNGDKLCAAVSTFAKAWGDEGFLSYISDPDRVSFPCSMIDKITPGPAPVVAEMLKADALAGMDEPRPPFVNAEECEYLVVEDRFPNGRPPLEKAGIYLTDRETVDKAERMKVCSCLNPLHTALAVYGCLLGYTHIPREMSDPQLSGLVRRLGYRESLPVVADPGIIRPRDFLDQFVERRLPNLFLPDTPQRIATDTSQKLPQRFGITIASYAGSPERDVHELHMIPLVLAGWLRYLMGIDDAGEPFDLSPDPLLSTVRPFVEDIRLGEVPPVDALMERFRSLLSRSDIFGVDLYEVGLAERICTYFAELAEGTGAVRRTLTRHVTEEA